MHPPRHHNYTSVDVSLRDDDVADANEYQGRLAFIGILPLALVFRLYFVRTRRLWPVVVARMLFDTFWLLSIVRH